MCLPLEGTCNRRDCGVPVRPVRGHGCNGFVSMSERRIDRRRFCEYLAAHAAAAGIAASAADEREEGWGLRYVVASSMYGRMKLSVILPEVRPAGAEVIDIWPEHHANQREQVEAMGHERFAEMLRRHKVRLGVITRYDLGPFALGDELKVARKLGCPMIVCGARGPGKLSGGGLKGAVKEFVEKMRPHLARAREARVTIAIENHQNSLVESPDSIRWLAEFSRSRNLGVALAPYHLAQDASLVAGLIRDLGEKLAHFYAWQYGRGCMEKLPTHEQLLQMPGRGLLDFAPIVAALKDIGYRRLTEIFMHPVPRGIPILPTAAEVTAEINRSRRYLEACLGKVRGRVSGCRPQAKKGNKL